MYIRILNRLVRWRHLVSYILPETLVNEVEDEKFKIFITAYTFTFNGHLRFRANIAH
jgi:hypothetical protein